MCLPSALLCLCLVRFAATAEISPSHWKDRSDTSCGGRRQSPIDIVTRATRTSRDLASAHFTIKNINSQNTLGTLTNNGHSVACGLNEDMVEVSGGGLRGTYSSLGIHFHWGDGAHRPGSEHTVNGRRFPMEMQIVSVRKGLSVEDGLADPEGLAVLGFFILATDDTGKCQPWDDLTSYLESLGEIGSSVPINRNISIGDLIGDVDLTKFFRYKGSLTTRGCDEAALWTVFHEPIKISKKLIARFPTNVGFTNTYRPVQPLHGRTVYTSAGRSSFGPILFVLLSPVFSLFITIFCTPKVVGVLVSKLTGMTKIKLQ